MTTDTALGVTKLVVQDKSKILSQRTPASLMKILTKFLFDSPTRQDSLRRTYS